MADWERLTSGPGHAEFALPLEYQECGDIFYRHHIRKGHDHFYLGDPELDALATKSGAVQALALIARECRALMRLRMEQDAGLGRDHVMERACDVLEATLAPFEEHV